MCHQQRCSTGSRRLCADGFARDEQVLCLGGEPSMCEYGSETIRYPPIFLFLFFAQAKFIWSSLVVHESESSLIMFLSRPFIYIYWQNNMESESKGGETKGERKTCREGSACSISWRSKCVFRRVKWESFSDLANCYADITSYIYFVRRRNV